MNKKAWLAGMGLVIVVAIGALYRFYDIQNFPPGLFPDEAANGEDVRLILEGDWRPFYPRGNGREALFFYLQAISVKLFGIGFWQMHIVSATIGTLTVAAMYFATRVWFGRIAGLLAAFFLATNYWHVTMSRTGFRAILIPLFLALFTAWAGYTIKAVREGKMKRSYVYAALTGAAFMGGFYTYIAYRVMIGVVGGIVVLLALAAMHPKIGWPHFRRYGKQLMVAIAAGLLVISPLAWHFMQNPADFVGRAGQVSVFNKSLQEEYGGGTLAGTILYSLRETVMAFFAGEGDLNWRHNVAGFPLLNPLVGVLGLLGVLWMIRGVWLVFRKVIHGEEIHLGMIYVYVLLMLGGMTLPVITTAEGMPHGLRSIGLVFPIFFLAGVAGAVILNWCRMKGRGRLVKSVCFGVTVGLLPAAALYDGALYFLVARYDSGAHYAYRADLIEVVEYIKEVQREEPEVRPYLVLDSFSQQTPHFLLSVEAHDHVTGDNRHPDEDRHRFRALERGEEQNIDLLPGEIMIFTQSTMEEAKRYEVDHPEAELVETRMNEFDQEIMRVYEGAQVRGVQDEGQFDEWSLDG